MNAWPHLFGVAAKSADAGSLDTGTAVLILLTLAVAWLASSVQGLRNEVQELKDSLQPAPQPGPDAAPAAGPDPAVVAAIAAAVICVFGTGARVVAVASPHSDGSAWSREGRREVFQSHQLR